MGLTMNRRPVDRNRFGRFLLAHLDKSPERAQAAVDEADNDDSLGEFVDIIGHCLASLLAEGMGKIGAEQWLLGVIIRAQMDEDES